MGTIEAALRPKTRWCVCLNLHYWTWGPLPKVGHFRWGGRGGSKIYYNINGKFNNIIIIDFTATAATPCPHGGQTREIDVPSNRRSGRAS